MVGQHRPDRATPGAESGPGHSPGHPARWDGETERERLNRNFAELLQEVRVTETGVQILFAFLLTLPFTNRFDRLDSLDINAYAVATVGAAVATITLVAPVSYHRLTFRTGHKPEIVRVASVLAQAGLVAFGISLMSAGFLIADVVLGLGWGIGFAALLTCLEAMLWYILPVANRRGGIRPGPPPTT